MPLLQRMLLFGQAPVISHLFWGQFWLMHIGDDIGPLQHSQQFTSWYA